MTTTPEKVARELLAAVIARAGAEVPPRLTRRLLAAWRILFLAQLVAWADEDARMKALELADDDGSAENDSAAAIVTGGDLEASIAAELERHQDTLLFGIPGASTIGAAAALPPDTLLARVLVADTCPREPGKIEVLASLSAGTGCVRVRYRFTPLGKKRSAGRARPRELAMVAVDDAWLCDGGDLPLPNAIFTVLAAGFANT